MRAAALPGLDPAWSRHVTVLDADGVPRDWHVLDNGVTDPVGTLLCVHGNPTWSYLWRRLLAAAPPGWRVLAPDQLGMGWSQRPDAPRPLERRVADLGDLTAALGVAGPVVTVAHDWGGVISLGWALAHRDQLRGVVLTNTAVAQPEGDFGPVLIRLSRALLGPVTVRTPVFVRAATLLSRPALPRAVRRAYAAPYPTAADRRSVGDFVADIPFSVDHPSRPALDAINTGIRSLDVPVLLLWGPRDPVFADRYLADLRARLPQAELHRYEGASHLLPEDAPQYAGAVVQWVTDLEAGRLRGRTPAGPAATAGRAPADPGTVAGRTGPAGAGTSGTGTPGTGPVGAGTPGTGPVGGGTPGTGPVGGAAGDGERRWPWSAPAERAGDPSPAVVEVGGRTTTWADLDRRTTALAAGLAHAGVRPGDRVALLAPPSADLTAAVYGVWRAGGVIVVADKGLGFAGMRRALRGAAVDHVVAAGPGLAAARAMRLPGTLIAAGPDPAAARRAAAVAGRALGAAHTLGGLEAWGLAHPAAPIRPDPDDDCAVIFTSGATGPAKGVVYTQRQVVAQLALVRRTYRLGPEDRFVAAFAPFALLGPALGIGSAVPDIDVTRPGELTAAKLADAAAAVDATVVFASPAALRRVVATAAGLSGPRRAALGRVRLLMSAGAPVPAALLHAVGAVLPAAELHTPYGMTEALPLTDISVGGIDAAGPGEGVCVGRPLPGVSIRLSPLSPTGAADGPLTGEPDVTGEICVRAAHVKDRYDALWATERTASRDPGWHRTGDVGHLDGAGRLWVEGRLQHVIPTAAGVVTPVGVEQRVERLDEVAAAAAVGVGPAGAQVVAVVVVPAFPDTAGRAAGARRVAGAALRRLSRTVGARRPGAGPAGRPSGRGRGPVPADPTLADAVRKVAGVEVAAVLVADALPVDIRHASKVDRAAVARDAARVLAGP